jgi:hypothetical protein
MARRKTVVAGVKVPRGENMPSTAKGWRIETPGKKMYLKAALVTKFKAGTERFAIFRILT